MNLYPRALLMSLIVAVTLANLALSQNGGITYATNSARQRPAGASSGRDFSWEGRVAPGGVVEVKGLRGNIRAEVVPGDLVEVVAVKRGTGDPAQVKIQVAEYDGGITLCAEYPAVDPARPFRCSPGKMGEKSATSTDITEGRARIEFENGGGGEVQLVDVWVDFTVRLPAKVGFMGFTVDGTVDVDSPSSDVSAESVLGNVTVKLPESAGAEVRAKSAVGGVQSDWRLSFKNGKFVGQKATGTIGRGGLKLYLCSATGNVRLLRAG